MTSFKIPSSTELIADMQSVSEEVANYFMDMALNDVKNVPDGANNLKQELSYKLYRAYLIGYCVSQNNCSEVK